MAANKDLTRIRSDYMGAGAYVVTPDDDSVIVNTTYGVQCVGLDSKVRWQAELGERCLGLAWRSDGVLLASTVRAVHQIDRQGQLLDSSTTRREVARQPVPYKDGLLLVTLTRLYALDEDGKVRWRYKLRESLGESVRAVFVVDVFTLRDRVVLGAVDYDSGVGRVLVIDDTGTPQWKSEVGPVTSLFPVGKDEFVYTLSGYGRFESCRSNIGGERKWQIPDGGPGLELPDGRLAVLVGNNECPTWDNWELRISSAAGVPLGASRAKGRCCHRPVLGGDGCLYFAGFLKPIDPSESRIEYTSYVRQPQFVAFDYLMRVKTESHQYRVYYFRGTLGGELELLFEDKDSVAFGPTVASNNHVFFVHNRDLLVVKTEGAS